MKPIILASTSPRRKELLEKIGLKFQTVSVDYIEVLDPDKEPRELARILSQGKAEMAALKYQNHIVIAADTFVVIDGELLGKPHNADEASRMLRKISGNKISVITGFTVLDTSENKKISRAVETKVHIKELSDQEIHSYVKTGEPLDKAGGFAIQGLGSVIVEGIEGDFYNVVGLPIFELTQSLKDFGINVLGG